MGTPIGRAIAFFFGLFAFFGGVENTRPGTILAVRHSWHLPRIKSAYRRAGRTVFTVPARESYTLSKTPYLIARKSVAFWRYLLA